MFSHLFSNKPQNLFLIDYFNTTIFIRTRLWEHFLDQRSCIHIVQYAVLVLFFFYYSGIFSKYFEPFKNLYT